MKNIDSARLPVALMPQTMTKHVAVLRRAAVASSACGVAFHAMPAGASFLHGDTLDAAADVIAWVALVIGPIVAIAVFWLVHILPEKIAEQKNHPQAKAIQTLCLLSLVFGGLLWPVAWLWAYSKPVLYKMAYGTDVGDHHASGDAAGDEAAIEDPEIHRSHVMKVIEREHELQVDSATNRERA
jgi:hypothetical protein